MEVLRAFGAWAGPLSASRLRLWAALLLQHSKAVKPKQRQELGASALGGWLGWVGVGGCGVAGGGGGGGGGWLKIGFHWFS